MLHVRDGRTFMVLFDRCSIQVFHAAALFALIHSCRGQSEVIGPLQPVVALIGDDIILPCNLDPVMDAFGLAVEWARADLDPRFVLLSRHGVDLESKKHPSYTSRTSLFTDELKNGNISLKISKVKLSDEGTYRCFVPELDRYTTVQLVVGAASSPAAWINSTISSRVVLQCESAGWYPEPELLWLDGEGNLLSAGPTETLRGPDDLYTVSSRVTVEKRHSNNITCRVQQRNTNQSRETHIHVPDDFFIVISPSSPPSNPTNDPNIIAVVIGALVVLILILAVSFVVWKKRRAKCKKKKSEEDGAEIGLKGESEPLMSGKEEDDDVDRREAQIHEDKREIKQDQLVLETERMKDIKSPQEERINPSNDRESLITIEQETHEEQDVTGREEEHDVDNSGEKKLNEEREIQKGDYEKETEHRQDTKSPEEERMSLSVITKKEPELEMKEKTPEQQSRRGREEEQNMNMRGEQRNKDEIHLRSTDDDRINQDVMAEKVSQSTTEQQTNEVQGRDEEGDVDNSGEKKRKKKQKKMIKKKTKKKQSKELDADSSGTKTSAVAETGSQFEMKQETREEQSRRGRYEIHNVDIRGEQRNEDEIQTGSTGDDRINQFIMAENVSQSTAEQQTNEEEMTGRGIKAEGAEGEGEKKKEAEKDCIELCLVPLREKLKKSIVLVKEGKSLQLSSFTSLISDVKFLTSHLSSDQEPQREKETQQEQLVEKRQMERNVDMKKSDTEKKRAEENRDDGNNLYSVFMAQKETQREKLEPERQREENQRDNMGMTERKTEEQRGQTESRISSVSSKVPLNTDLKIQDKTRGQNHEKQPDETSQQSREDIREQPEKLRGAERKERAQGKELEVNEGLTYEETNRKDKKRQKLQLPHEGELQAERQVNVNEKEQLEESVSLTERGVVCLQEKQEEELMETDQPCDVDRLNIQSRENTHKK
ncbi:glutamic acid-rich protein [Oreochromis niloticus]|nr:glutamic acid-rich protein [Oreochromis niloticus]